MGFRVYVGAFWEEQGFSEGIFGMLWSLVLDLGPNQLESASATQSTKVHFNNGSIV